jgi:hypothetical protein
LRLHEMESPMMQHLAAWLMLRNILAEARKRRKGHSPGRGLEATPRPHRRFSRDAALEGS